MSERLPVADDLEESGRAPHVPLDDSAPAPVARRDLLALDDALNALAEIDPAKARIVELRYFGGLTAEEAAEVMGLSRVMLEREWRVARLWLTRELKGATP
jgi:DNA-directed RNA polymerase specialized sigma24 family protein